MPGTALARHTAACLGTHSFVQKPSPARSRSPCGSHDLGRRREQEPPPMSAHASLRLAARPLHPLQAILLSFPLPLFLGALLCDAAYTATFQIQWANFAAWLIAGALLIGGFALLWALVDVFRVGASQRGRQVLYFLALLLMWAVGFVNALIHAKDAFATMPEGLYLSAATVLLALIASWMGYSRFKLGDVS